MVTLAGVFGAFSGGVGAIFSALDRKLPTGPMIILAAFAIVLISLAFAPGRGVVWFWLQQRADRRRYAAQQVLTDLYKYASDHGGPADGTVPKSFVRGVRGRQAQIGLERLQHQGLIRSEGDSWRLTQDGVRLAEQARQSQTSEETADVRA
jgi:manganese/zinc/iron transport system permease protein